MSTPTIRVFVQKDGVVLHEHPGAKGLHGPWIRHSAADAHKGVSLAAVVKELTPEQRDQYKEALAGKNFSFMWENRKATQGTWREQSLGLAPRALRDAKRVEREANERVFQGLSAEELVELGDPAGFTS